MHRPAALYVSCVLCFTRLFSGAQPRAASRPASRTATSPVTKPATLFSRTSPTTAPANSMPRNVLELIDHRELGAKYDPARADRYYEIHKLLEMYFATTSIE